MTTTVLAFDGQLLCLQRSSSGWCVHVHEFVDEAFAYQRSVDLRGSGDVDLSSTELVAADAVMDTFASLPAVVLAFRRPRGSTHDYWVGMVGLEQQCCTGDWHPFELAEVEAYAVADGPVQLPADPIVPGNITNTTNQIAHTDRS